MKKVLVFVYLCILLSTNTFAQTYYYERVATVTNGVKSSDSGDGHFITFTNKGCYDSNKEGFDEKFGFREYKATNDGIKSYYGDSYFGKAYYYFTEDLGRLNIKKESDNTIFVYIKKVAPTGVTKSSREAPNKDIVIIPVIPTPQPNDITVPTNDEINSTESSSISRYGYYTCPSCYGSGKCPNCNGKHLVNSSYTGNTRICSTCNNRGQCSACNGTGQKYGVIR